MLSAPVVAVFTMPTVMGLTTFDVPGADPGTGAPTLPAVRLGPPGPTPAAGVVPPPAAGAAGFPPSAESPVVTPGADACPLPSRPGARPLPCTPPPPATVLPQAVSRRLTSSAGTTRR